MLIISLVFSLILALASWGLSRRMQSKGAGLAVCLLGCGFCVFTFVNQFLMPAFVLQALVLGVLFAAAKATPSLKAVLVASAVAYAPSSLYSLATLNDQAELQASYPFESVRDRAPAPKAEWRTPLSAESEAALEMMEHSGFRDFGGFLREQALRRLHASHMLRFISSPGFGVSRDLSQPNARRLKGDFRDEPLKQEGSPLGPTWSPQEGGAPDEPRHDLLGRHITLLMEGFLPKGSFGLFRSRDAVAGFQPHQFNEAPRWEGDWQIQNIELVSLLLHDVPVVYVSDSLPRMADVGKVPTRPTDFFESKGLAKLKEGEELFAKRKGDEMRLLGAIRAAKQCADCHAAQRGDLLGAFSYSLVRPWREPKKDGAPPVP